jgi:DNA-binding winged helix-turn-helix (wHTH) protein
MRVNQSVREIDADVAMPRYRDDCERISFGEFNLFPVARVLEKHGIPLPLGSRALDLLIVLVERAGEVVTHRDLIARVWRGLVVDHVNLRVQMTSLRKALGDKEAGARYIANITGQGYSFVAPLQRFPPTHFISPRTSKQSERFVAALALALGVPFSNDAGGRQALDLIVRQAELLR